MKRNEKEDAVAGYQEFVEYLLKQLEHAQKRYMEAEGLLMDMLPWWGRMFAKKRILKVLKKYVNENIK